MNNQFSKAAESIKEQIDKSENEKVRLALFGHSGAGKSSIINKLLGENLAVVGVETDTTTELTTYEWNGLILTDLPGYNTKKFPSDEYVAKFNILTDYDIFICVFEGKLSKDNSELFELLQKNGKACIFVRNKCDQIWDEQKSYVELTKQIENDLNAQIGEDEQNVIFVSCRSNKGFDLLQNEIAIHLEVSKKEKWIQSAAAYSFDFLQEKKKQARKKVVLYSGLSALNGVNPVPGLDVAIDLGILQKLLVDLKKVYGLKQDKLEDFLKLLNPADIKQINDLITYGTKSGINALIKRFAVREGAKISSKYVPLVGQAVAASLGFSITYAVGFQFLNECHSTASAILEYELEQSSEKVE